MALLIIAWTARNWNAPGVGRKGEKTQAAPPVPSGHEQRRKNFELGPAEKSASSNPEIIPSTFERFLYKGPK